MQLRSVSSCEAWACALWSPSIRLQTIVETNHRASDCCQFAVHSECPKHPLDVPHNKSSFEWFPIPREGVVPACCFATRECPPRTTLPS